MKPDQLQGQGWHSELGLQFPGSWEASRNCQETEAKQEASTLLHNRDGASGQGTCLAGEGHMLSPGSGSRE